MKLSLRERFEKYVNPYFAGMESASEGAVYKNLLLKKEHTERVLNEALLLAAQLRLPERERRIAGAAALFHDISRFPQYYQYGTFQDTVSRNHGVWSRQIVEDEALLVSPVPPEPPVDSDEMQIILSAIEWHNAIDLPPDLNDKTSKHCCLLRDADKIDIFYVASVSTLHPGGLSKSDDNLSRGSHFQTLLDAFIRGENADNRLVETALDQYLLMLTWLHDLNYRESKVRIGERKLVDPILARFTGDKSYDDIKTRLQTIFSSSSQ